MDHLSFVYASKKHGLKIVFISFLWPLTLSVFLKLLFVIIITIISDIYLIKP